MICKRVSFGRIDRWAIEDLFWTDNLDMFVVQIHRLTGSAISYRLLTITELSNCKQGDFCHSLNSVRGRRQDWLKQVIDGNTDGRTR